MNNQNIPLVLFLAFAILFGTASCILTKIPTTSLTPTPTTSLTPTPTTSLTPTPTTSLTPTPTATLTPTATPAPTLQPGDFEHQVTVDGQDRNYLLYIPPGLRVQQPVPVVFVFHGYRGSPSGMQPVTGYNDIADLGNFLVVYPEGLEQSWNAGNCCGHAIIENVDEPAFIRQILSDLDTITGIDPKRIYGTGWSNGAALTYRLACEMSEIFAAIGPVSGSLGYSPCHPQQPVSIIHVHGLADNAVPYSGGGPFDFPPVEQGIDTWVQLNNCRETTQVEIPYEALTIKHTTYTSCQAGTAIELYTIDLGTHGWPSSKHLWPASETIWDFFNAHPKP